MIRLFEPELGRLLYTIGDANKKVAGIIIFYNSPTVIKQRIMGSSTIQVFNRDIQQHEATIDTHRKAVTAVHVTHEECECVCEANPMIR
ncbi:MAG: hypothetical protein EZS28_020628 [Streblomastix strix]|uniref:Uncharacterized protein n=1 Tax=Streblomastix strix TaxID=222440 RepID=A0A5J4VN90_9EUKA|nr:MAG: hypothetical protein EZS28_020628 [Streblomastix strix]